MGTNPPITAVAARLSMPSSGQSLLLVGLLVGLPAPAGLVGLSFRIRPRFRRNQALWAKNTDADGFGICSPLVFDRSAEQIGRKPICPNLIGTGSSLIYQISYLFLNRNPSRIGPRRRQNHKAWPEIWTRTGTDPGLVPVFVKTIRNGLIADAVKP